ncbi:DUF6542 domain-containing protein [Streptomyces beijiangensis]|uniref:DUF6542 domain-containing protein n=1 Tax=Streptomyces beijiangensis TaxID=163361 RepID=A0A939JME6_9ACTN|nr:hypothetical protein [Streptomyces beijiangensis]
MEQQHRTRTPRPDVPSQTGRGETATVYRASGGRPARPVAPLVLALRRLPSPRLTGLGGGLFAVVAMLAVGAVDWLLLDGSALAYGLLFLPVSVATAMWVRPADLVTAPISVPIAFAVGSVLISDGAGDGLGGSAMGVLTTLALHAGWLYGGTLLAAVIMVVRRVRVVSERRRER